MSTRGSYTEDCSDPGLSLLSMDLGMLLSESSRFFDPIYPPLREIALRLDRVQEALASARPFPFCYYIPPTGRVFDVQAEIAAAALLARVRSGNEPL